MLLFYYHSSLLASSGLQVNFSENLQCRAVCSCALHCSAAVPLPILHYTSTDIATEIKSVMFELLTLILWLHKAPVATEIDTNN